MPNNDGSTPRRTRPVFPRTAARVTAALEKTGGRRKEAAKLLGISTRRLVAILRSLRESGIKVQESPQSMVAYYQPTQAAISGASTLYGADGEVKLQWVKEKAGPVDPEEFSKIVREAFTGMTPRTPVVASPAKRLGNLLAVYPMGDPHIGMYSWAAETGQAFNLEIAERNLVAATEYLVKCCPPAEQALIVNVGDFFHADNVLNRTMRSGNVLDVDTRWAKVLRVGLRTMRACIDAALKKHEKVTVINEIGNHDEHSGQMLSIALAMYYEQNPRVTFDESPARFHYFRFGDVLIGVTHGDTVKPEQLGPLMAVDRAVEWGETKHRYWYTGHIHHRKVIETAGCVAESFRTLAARDAWTAGMGYRSGRDMVAIVLDKTEGEIQRHRIDIATLEKMFETVDGDT